ncbi:MAG: SDR family oxidoreductase [Hyphomicrobiales bacterium]|nr:SDR family oxidoreductase [Hyphomicrobiales bacterium]
MQQQPTIAVLGASGLIGRAVAAGLRDQDFRVVAIARRFTAAQKAEFGGDSVEVPFVSWDATELAALFSDHRVEGVDRVDVVVNCVGVLQGGGADGTVAVHDDFVRRLVSALASRPTSVLLVHLTIPGAGDGDRTDFAQTKRAGERSVVGGDVPHVLLRPGFVVAPPAYGGSALMRALATLPVALPAAVGERPFAVTDVRDIVATVGDVARRWSAGECRWSADWDVMAPEIPTVSVVVDAFRRRLGGPSPIARLPSWLMDLGAMAGDLAGRLGWRPPIRSNALAEMRRGVAGDPKVWMEATGIVPQTLTEAVQAVPASVQEAWFARLYLLKPLIIAVLAVFWALSGVIALAAFDAATAILLADGFPRVLAVATTMISSLIDITIGIAIAFRRTCRAGLYAGIAVSIFYMTGAAVLTPELWLEPLGALVKTGPAIVLMIVALVTLEDR